MNFKKYENYFFMKKSFVRSKEVKIRVQKFFFLNFARFIFANAWI